MTETMALDWKTARALRVVIAVCWAASTAILMQFWIGGATIYQVQHEAGILQAHRAILENRPPKETWNASGMNSDNIRLGAVLLAEGIHRASGLNVRKIYWVIDTGALFASLLLLLAFLTSVVPVTYAVIGSLAFAAVLPLTYQLFFFHPWDRLSLALWLMLLLALRHGRLVLLAAVLPLAMFVKFDVILIPLLVLLVRAPWPPRREEMMRTLGLTASLLVLSFGTYWGLRWLRPGGFEPRPLRPQFETNLSVFTELNVAYPPLLGFGVLILLAVVGFRRADRFGQACAVFSAVILGVLAAQTNFVEIRAEMPVFLLLLPAALTGLRAICESQLRTAAAPVGP